MRFNTTLLAAAIALGLSAQSAQAIDLIAIGQLPGTLADASGQSAPLENGVRGDLLGGMGSGLAWAGGHTFLALPDRGPNAVSWNASVDNTASYVPRSTSTRSKIAVSRSPHWLPLVNGMPMPSN